jgi:hypothetical protein
MATLTCLACIPEAHWYDWIQVECPCCGRFLIKGTLIALWDAANSNKASEEDLNLRRYLSSHTRQANARKEVMRLDEDNWQGFAKMHRDTTQAQKLKQLLEFIKSRSQSYGANVVMNTALEYAVIDAASPAEFECFLNELEKCHYIEMQRKIITKYCVSLSPQGHAFLQRQERPPITGSSSQGVEIHIHSIGHFNQGERTTIDAILLNVSSLADSGNVEIATALKNLTESLADSQELEPGKRAEALELLGDLSKQAALPPESRSTRASLRLIGAGLASIYDTAAGLTVVWSTYGPVMKAFFGF